MIVVAAFLLVFSVAGIGYVMRAGSVVGRFGRMPLPTAAPEPVSLLKPLHGTEPRLAENLAGFLDQRWGANIEMVLGVQRTDDPALVVANGLRVGHSTEQREVKVVLDATAHGLSGKVSNLVNMLPAASHDLIVLSDSDMAVPPDYLTILAGALAAPGIGAVTCVYRGRGDAGAWSRMAAAAISYHFLPQLLLGLRYGLARPGMGSTIALRRGTLDAIGGFVPFADRLADDYAIGEAVRALGLAVAVPEMLLVHGCSEKSLRDLWLHERRWANTIRIINPVGHAGTLVTYPVPMALLLAIISPLPGLVLTIIAVTARLWLKAQIDRIARTSTAPAWMIVPRDCLSFAVFVTSFVARSVDWRGQRLRVGRRGLLINRPSTADPENSP